MNLKGINRYLSVGVDANWIRSYIKDRSFEPGNRKTDVMFGFMGDAGLVSKRKETEFGKKIFSMDLDNEIPWALMLCNLAYTPAFRWFIKNIPFNESYIESRLDLDMGDDVTEKAKGEFWNGFKVILDTNALFRNCGMGLVDITAKETKTGIKKSLNSITRLPWKNPDAKVILYSLYKFAEKCDGYYQFTLTRLLDHEAESDGVSPTEIFGLDRETMEKLLRGLSVNYPDFISADFQLGLDTITLNSEKTSADVLELI